MTLSERSIGNVVILDVEGNIQLADGAELLRDKVRSLLQEGHRALLINLAGVAYIDSAGLGELVQGYATTVKQGGSLKLVHATKRLHDLLVITKLSNVFDLFDDEATAVSSFGAKT
jgi:anti-sigma B factor antagonist